MRDLMAENELSVKTERALRGKLRVEREVLRDRVAKVKAAEEAKVAAARKLLINCYVMLRDGISYEEFIRRGEVGLCEGSGEVNKGKPIQSLEV